MSDEQQDEAIMASLLAHKLKLSIKAIEMAKEAAWRDLPHNEQRTYMRYAEAAVRKELGKERM